MLNALLTCDTNVGAEVSLKFIQTSEWNVLSEMVEQLPYDYRIVIQLRYWEEWTTARIAAIPLAPNHYGELAFASGTQNIAWALGSLSNRYRGNHP